jgi:hypothetical protein
MKVFIAHAHADKQVAREIATKLRSAGIEVFLDEDSLSPGQEYDRRIRDEIKRVRVFVFLASLNSIQPGCYALTELALAKRFFRNPNGRVLPVLLGGIDATALDPYLVAGVTALAPRGNVAAEVTAEVERMLVHRSRRLFVALASGLTALVVGSLAAAKTTSSWISSDPVSTDERSARMSPEQHLPPPVAPPPLSDAVVAPTPTAVEPLPPPIRCSALRVAKSPSRNFRRWPVHERPEHVSLVCHVADNESVDVLCRQGLNAVCIEGPDSDSGKNCQGYIHSDAFVFGKILAAEVVQLPRCQSACPPIKVCEAN